MTEVERTRAAPATGRPPRAERHGTPRRTRSRRLGGWTRRRRRGPLARRSRHVSARRTFEAVEAGPTTDERRAWAVRSGPDGAWAWARVTRRPRSRPATGLGRGGGASVSTVGERVFRTAVRRAAGHPVRLLRRGGIPKEIPPRAAEVVEDRSRSRLGPQEVMDHNRDHLSPGAPVGQDRAAIRRLCSRKRMTARFSSGVPTPNPEAAEENEASTASTSV